MAGVDSFFELLRIRWNGFSVSVMMPLKNIIGIISELCIGKVLTFRWRSVKARFYNNKLRIANAYLENAHQGVDPEIHDILDNDYRRHHHREGYL